MRILAILAAAAALTASAALAQTPAPPASPGLCLRSIDIDHTKSPNDHVVLFYMRDGKVWQSNLRNNCPELSFNGFIYVSTPPDDICPNVQMIRVIHSGAVCMMGPLEAYVPPPKS
ncbi:MAG: hypothetical protein ABSC92_05540 [Rhizomicrobium sp.]|jgi:hypothetical protein